MQESRLPLAEFGYLYNSLYTYRRKIEADIRTIIKADTQAHLDLPNSPKNDNAQSLLELTQKLRKISIIISRVISLNKGYRRSAL
ncbi:hypothetical protein [Adhaeribacter pallidiroseus]|uniref:Uncharacterized protein n=1 Tax=Adhaeribacter pallidiroseus TaxID=2072847 RepID=A0A369QEA5_9BACT|nr:hypothetical protein [Adhaeribacter pallidiroseus]RDC61577.1 hypothetical protein AHMF7616_00156 [Adhaeribacter pallidiroseus]